MNTEEAAEKLKAHGVKPTANRIIVMKALAEADRPMTMSELEYGILSIDKSGVFRTLSLFRQHRLVHVIEDGGDGVRYELCRSSDIEHDDDNHVHFYCECCRKTFCLTGIAVPVVTLPDGFMMTGVNYMVKGRCCDCKK